MLRRQDKDRRWRTNYKRLETEVNSIEEDEYQLERVYPQVRKRVRSLILRSAFALSPHPCLQDILSTLLFTPLAG